MTRMTFQEATVRAIAEEMRADPSVFVMGEDVGAFGGPLRSTAGLHEQFGTEGRVIDTPISESTFTGVGVGAAMYGKRPVVDLMFLEFLPLVMQQLLDAGAMHYYSGGAQRVPLVVRAKYGIGPFHGHAFDHHSWATNLPGVRVVAPSNPADAYTMMRAAIRDDNPILFLEHMALYHAGRAEVAGEKDASSLSTARVAREGTDVTIAGSAAMVKKALTAATRLDKEGISAEVVDLRSLAPLETGALLASVHKTGRALVLSEAVARGSSSNDVIRVIACEAFDALRAAPVLLASSELPVPFARELEAAYVPGVHDIAEAARQLSKA